MLWWKFDYQIVPDIFHSRNQRVIPAENGYIYTDFPKWIYQVILSSFMPGPQRKTIPRKLQLIFFLFVSRDAPGSGLRLIIPVSVKHFWIWSINPSIKLAFILNPVLPSSPAWNHESEFIFHNFYIDCSGTWSQSPDLIVKSATWSHTILAPAVNGMFCLERSPSSGAPYVIRH